MNRQSAAISLAELAGRISDAVNRAAIHNVWVCAETSDLRTSGGHCYMELIQKNPDSGATLAKLRATIWSSRFASLNTDFRAVTGAALSSGIRVMVMVSASFHPVYGFNLVVTDINPDYTMGDLLRRRREILARLDSEGVIDMNKQLEWLVPVQRIALISAAGAAGYGDFIHQLYNNKNRLNFTCELFPAVLQGEKAPASIISALEQIAGREDEFDCVAIIRGGGASSDLASFDSYDLAANVAQFPLPVIVGIGHERDVTVLDYVAGMRVKTPTAAAEWLISQGEAQLDRLHQLAADLYRLISERISGNRRQLAYIEGQLSPLLRSLIIARRQRLDNLSEKIPEMLRVLIERQRQRIGACAHMLEALSPQATLRRGFTITRNGNVTLRSVSELNDGDTISTIFADGSVEYTINL